MTNLTSVATRYAGRPLLLAPSAAVELAERVRAVDPDAIARPSRFSALIRRLGSSARRATAMDESVEYVPEPIQLRLAYAPLYAGEPDDVGFCWSLKDGIALMQVDKPMLDRGEIFCGEVYHGYDTVLQGLREAMADDRVRGIFIRMATPGGVVASGLPALADYIRQNNANNGGKPIHVYADMACSAGYWSICGADRISASRVGMIGSIGAVVVHENWSEALKKAGVEITPIQFGTSKTDGAWFAGLSEKARADLQAEIDQIGRDFVAAVSAARPQLSEAEILAQQAAVFLGHHDDPTRSALSLKLIDAHSTEEEAFEALRDSVAEVSAVGGSTANFVPETQTSAVGARDRASASPDKEATVAKRTSAGGKPSQTALARAVAAANKANAEVLRIAAEQGGEPEDDDRLVEEEDNKPADANDPEEEVDPADVDDDTTEEENEAKKIAASAEAASHPAAATAAIASGMTYAQFKGQVKAQGGGARRLASVMSGTQRLGPDATAGTGRSDLSPSAIYSRRAARARRKAE
ncbi:S49 family peptidase [Brevundimonas sp.]|uniref:S49 family peptidase n=1 Tax=Brevundimonas sp. TaxID=1871086 RepID=UPI0028A0CD53|nr:S49 family peptidase [Brevundimonas sp.]